MTAKYRAEFSIDGWYVTYGERRPRGKREWLQGPLTQREAEQIAADLSNSNQLVDTIVSGDKAGERT